MDNTAHSVHCTVCRPCADGCQNCSICSTRVFQPNTPRRRAGPLRCAANNSLVQGTRRALLPCVLPPSQHVPRYASSGAQQAPPYACRASAASLQRVAPCALCCQLPRQSLQEVRHVCQSSLLLANMPQGKKQPYHLQPCSRSMCLLQGATPAVRLPCLACLLRCGLSATVGRTPAGLGGRHQ